LAGDLWGATGWWRWPQHPGGAAPHLLDEPQELPEDGRGVTAVTMAWPKGRGKGKTAWEGGS